jgi:uncharacterized protein (DUF885 family)
LQLRTFKRPHLAFCILPVLLMACSNQHKTETGAPNAHDTLRKVADDWWQFFLRTNPETATQLGEYAFNDDLSDLSAQRAAQVRSEAVGFQNRLNGITDTGLSDSDQLDLRVLRETVRDQIKGSDLKLWEMPVDQMNGIHLQFAQLSTFVPLDTVKHYDDYLARLHKIPSRLEQAIVTMRLGEKDGLMPPKFLLEKTVTQCSRIAEPEGSASVFAEPIKKLPKTFSDSDRERLQSEITKAINDEVRPAYRHFEQFLKTEYAPNGRTQPGVWSLPDGDERYRFAVQTQTTSELSPEQIHQLGLQQVKDIEEQIQALAAKAGFKTGKAFIASVHSNPSLKAKSREQILNNFRHYIGQMEPKIPELFGRLPKAKVVVASVPAFMEKEGSTEYMPGTPDGSRPGQVWVDTYDATHHDMLDDEATAYHEGIPGHHLQVSIAQELPNIHPFHRALNYNAYVEGWALYAERLGKDVGFYQEPSSDLGRLQSELFRAVRLVVDTGVHYKHWSRQQMVDFFTTHFGDPQETEVDRYIAWPGQALGYKLGQLKLLELRERAKAKLGSKFDLRRFHDEVLGAGALPLNLLDARIDRWIEATNAG